MTRLASSLTHATLVQLFRKADAERWALSREEFARAVAASVAHAFAAAPPEARDLDRYIASLHVMDLALAAACALGREVAWNHFVLEHRPILYRAADVLDATGNARELADSLYADLFGVDRETGGRRSLFEYFHGRSSLATWLRAVLAQRYVDALRARKRVEPLADHEDVVPAAPGEESDPDRLLLVPLVQNALQAAIDGLPARDRLRLRSYYAGQLTLAEIGRITGEHEATVSRHLARTRRDLRHAVERSLRESAGLDEDRVGRAFELALEDPGELNLQQVFDSTLDRKDPGPDRSK